MSLKTISLTVLLGAMPLLANNALLQGLTTIVDTAETQKAEDQQVLNNAFKQRMKTQRMARDALLIAMDFNRSFYQKDILKNADEFNIKFQNLINDKKDIDKVITKLPEFKEKLTTFKTTWSQFYDMIKALSKDPKDQKALNYIINQNTNLLQDIDYIFSNFLRFYQSNDSLEKSMNHIRTMLFTQVGKPRMYITKIVKERLLIAEDINTTANQKALHKSIKNMDQLMKALKEGDKTLELNGTEDRKILEKLAQSQTVWEKLKVAIASATLDPHQWEKILQLNEDFIKIHNDVVTLTKASVDN